MSDEKKNEKKDELEKKYKKATGMCIVNTPEKNDGKTEFAKDKKAEKR